MKVSLCMIVRDEEETVGRCLGSVQGLFDEIVVVDTGSRDRTKEIARSFTPLVYDFEWRDDFSAARNFSLSKAGGDYLMWLDADDVIEGENYSLLRAELDALEATRPDAVMLPYNVMFEGERPVLSYYRERILRASAGFRFEGAVHEAVAVCGKVTYGKAAVSHRKIRQNEPGRNLRIIESVLRKTGALDPRMRYYYARELLAAGRTDEAVRWYYLCAADQRAWVENRVSSYFELSGALSALGRREESEKALFETLRLAPPRADVCCEIGRKFFDKGDLAAAEFWYRLAPKSFKRPGGFVHSDYGGYTPCLGLCMVFDRQGDLRRARRYNALAGKFKPDSPAVKANEENFKARLD